MLSNNSWLRDHKKILAVNFENPVHAFEAKQNATSRRQRTARKPRSSAAWNNRNVMELSDSDNLLHFLGRRRLDHNMRRKAEIFRFIVLIFGEIVGIGKQYITVSDDQRQGANPGRGGREDHARMRNPTCFDSQLISCTSMSVT